MDGVSYRDIKRSRLHHFLKIQEMWNENIMGTPHYMSIYESEIKRRNVYVYNIYDRIIQQCIKIFIEPIINKEISDNVLSNKKGIDFEKIVSNLLVTSHIKKPILKIDIENYYASINCEKLIIMLHEIGIDKSIVLKIQASISHCENGLPPGNCLSPLLANFYLTPIDKVLNDNYVRFGDDIYIFLDAIIEAGSIMNKMEVLLHEMGMKINQSKIN